MKKAEINFFNQNIKFSLKNKKKIKILILKIINDEHKELENINFIFCRDTYLLNLNKKYLNHDTYTDIISFYYNQAGEPLSGDIFISIDRAKENASTYKTTLINEIHRLIIHGSLHLAGFEDKTPAEKSLMTKKENFYLDLL